MTDALSFIEGLQTWLQAQNPARQLTPLDLYHAVRWHESGIPIKCFLDAFNEALAKKTWDFQKLSLKSFVFVAQRTIVQERSKYAQHQTAAPSCYDPFGRILESIVQVGKKCDNVLLKEELKRAYRAMRYQATKFYESKFKIPQSLEEFYEAKASALIAWDEILRKLLEKMQSYLTASERVQCRKLTPMQEGKMRLLSENAAREYSLRLWHQNMVHHLQIAELYDVLNEG